MARVNTTKRSPANGSALGFEATLWATADKLRGNLDAAEYKHVVLGLIFLKYISDAFAEKHAALQKEKGADPEDRDEYLARRFLPIALELASKGGGLPPVQITSGLKMLGDVRPDVYTMWAYYKPAATLDHLRASVGDDVFSAALKAYIARCWPPSQSGSVSFLHHEPQSGARGRRRTARAAAAREPRPSRP